jgi:3-oxoacyl-[acyl-carrier-protein] synthase III
VRSGLYRRVLMVFSCAVSRVLDYESGLSTVFGDAAAACVVGSVAPGYGLVGHWSRTDGGLREGVVYAPMVDGQPQPRWDRCAPGRIQLTTFDPVGAKKTGHQSTAYCREACLGALEDAGLSISDVSLLIVNQSVAWLVDACRRNLGLAEHQAIDTFSEVANIGSAALPYNLARAESEGRLHDGDIVLFYSPGAGFTRSACVYRWTSRGTGAA